MARRLERFPARRNRLANKETLQNQCFEHFLTIPTGSIKTGNALAGAAAAVGAMVASGAAFAAAEPWGIYLQPAASTIAEKIHTFSALTFWIITPITLLVLGLLIAVIVKFNAKANPVPSRTSHNTVIEVLWTVVPIIILLVIAVPSFRLLYAQQVIPEAAVTVKATGNKWFWEYEYPDADGFSFASNMIPEAEITDPATQPRLLAADNPLVVPVNKVIRVQVTGADVIHAFAMPAMGVKVDAMPGRLNEVWFQADHTGVFYGQCSELCGLNHAFMPIELHVVTDEQYTAWLAAAQKSLPEANKLLATYRGENAKTAVATN